MPFFGSTWNDDNEELNIFSHWNEGDTEEDISVFSHWKDNEKIDEEDGSIIKFFRE